jgi:hypothetical protein
MFFEMVASDSYVRSSLMHMFPACESSRRLMPFTRLHTSVLDIITHISTDSTPHSLDVYLDTIPLLNLDLVYDFPFFRVHSQRSG